MIEKYITVLLKTCLNLKSGQSLLVWISKSEEIWIEKIKRQAHDLGIVDIAFDIEDDTDKRKLLLESSIEELEKTTYFNKQLQNEYAKKKAGLLILYRDNPGVMTGVDPVKYQQMIAFRTRSKSYCLNQQLRYQIPWCIAEIPNQTWANRMFPGQTNCLSRLEDVMSDICMLKEQDPVQAWKSIFEQKKYRIKQLDQLQFQSLLLRTSLGTTLQMDLPLDHQWQIGGLKTLPDGRSCIVNFPSYEIFISPHCTRVKGIIYSSIPFVLDGSIVEDMVLEFDDGKATLLHATKGYEVVEQFLKRPGANYLGELGLVDYDSPISRTNLFFGSTLLDENAKSHVALGRGFANTLMQVDLSLEQLQAYGINQSNEHCDFMFGTDDLSIEGINQSGDLYDIMVNGDYQLRKKR